MDFDACAFEYGRQLDRGLKLSGEAPEWFARRRVAIVREVADAYGITVRSILEFGCGVGNHVPFLKETFSDADIVGVDVSSRSLSVARRRWGDGKTSFRQPTEIAENGAFDLAFVNGVFHHIAPEARGGWVDYLRDTLRDGGLLAVFDNNPFSVPARLVMKRIPFDRDAELVNPYRFVRLLGQHGLAPVRRRFYFLFPRTLAFLRPLEPLVTRWPLGAQFGLFARRAS